MIRRTAHRLHATIAALRAALRAGNNANTKASARRVAQHIIDTAGIDIDNNSKDTEIDTLVGSLITDLRRNRSAFGEPASGAILIVEDDRLTARVHADALAEIDCTVLTAGTGADAEALLREHDVAIVLLDLVLPDADGRDLLAHIRAATATRSLPIIVITSRTDPVTLAECFALGADTLLTKPVDPNVLAAAVAAQLDLAAERRLEGRIDRLTGLPNRAALLDTIERLAPLARRNRQPLSVAMIDLDFFKSVNDTYGHDMGDDVLQRVAGTIAGTLRISDLVARWGGEEFCALLPDTTPSGAVQALQKSLESVRQLVFEADGESFAVTFSAGVAGLQHDSSVSDVLKEADRLLYSAKQSGRNRIMSPADVSDPPRPRILLVEDDPAVSRMVNALLQREGFSLSHYTDGQSALEAAEREHFVLALVDLELPLLNGFEVVQRLRAIPRCAKLPIVLLTASGEEADIVRGFEVGANDYMVKPFFTRELAARINRLLPRR